MSTNDRKAELTRERGYYLCSEVDEPCHLSEWCAHVWNTARQWDAATVWVFAEDRAGGWLTPGARQLIVNTDHHGLDAQATADLVRTLDAAQLVIEPSNA